MSSPPELLEAHYLRQESDTDIQETKNETFASGRHISRACAKKCCINAKFVYEANMHIKSANIATMLNIARNLRTNDWHVVTSDMQKILSMQRRLEVNVETGMHVRNSKTRWMYRVPHYTKTFLRKTT